MVTVPSAYQGYVNSMAQATGIPAPVVAAQANEESGFNASAVSSAGAEGWLQFLPSTYNAYATQAGVPQGSEFNPGDEAKVYDVYMTQLLKQEGGSVFKALEAYNAGPGNLSAGSGYANAILKAAGQSSSLQAGAGTGSAGNATTTSSGFNLLDPATWLPTVFNSAATVLGVSSFKDMMQRLGLILLGVTLILVGILVLARGNNSSKINITTGSSTDENGQTTTTRRVKHPLGSSTSKTVSGGSMETGAGKAIEAAAVA
jgi:hypothetical protein